MLKAKIIYLKEKQAFSKDDGMMRLLGRPIDIAKKMKEEGMELLHVIDLDAMAGVETNFDIYNKLTYLMHIEVECGETEKLIEKLLKINARVVVELPTKKLDLKKYKNKERLLVGKIDAGFEGNVEDVYDLIIEDANFDSVKKFSKMKKRILVYRKYCKKEMEKLIFAVLE